MKQKTRFLLLGWVTLIVFPTFGYLLLWLFTDKSILAVLQPDLVFKWPSVLGLIFGIVYALLLIGLSRFDYFKDPFNEQSDLIRNLHLKRWQMLFIAVCAGFGEEVLFRASIQTWLGPWLTTLLFIAAHGYFNFKSFKRSLPGIVLFPFILGIALGYEAFGLWFGVAAHLSYDYLMLLSTRDKSDDFSQAWHLRNGAQ